jgi:hypothetical protein
MYQAAPNAPSVSSTSVAIASFTRRLPNIAPGDGRAELSGPISL